ncbi:hypothetical protein ACFQ36_01410 [Arthrobacter sp. GCM10027362]|uniref:hypothetical protein n=1 Tax=Arthrobacter sp. GCM10027362 TaxID=3273379 RepID=UPI003645C076
MRSLGIAALILVVGPGTVVLALLVIGLQFPAELYMACHWGIARLFFTPRVLIVMQPAYPVGTATLLIKRRLETLIRAAAGIAVTLALPDDHRAA